MPFTKCFIFVCNLDCNPDNTLILAKAHTGAAVISEGPQEPRPIRRESPEKRAAFAK